MMMRIVKWILIVVLVLAVAGAVAIYFGINSLKRFIPGQTVPTPTASTSAPTPVSGITTFEECVKAGNPITESYPVQCRTSDGQTFTQNVGNEMEFTDQIRVNTPRPNQEVTSPLEITGEARGPWYFEANFSVELVDENNTQLGTGIAQAMGEWMTEEFVPFTARIQFDQPTSNTGTLIIRNANPSGLPENEKELRIPVSFAQ